MVTRSTLRTTFAPLLSFMIGWVLAANVSAAELNDTLVFFDKNSVKLRPVTVAQLKSIGASWMSRPGQVLALYGHGDRSGSTAANHTLSERRVAEVWRAVKPYANNAQAFGFACGRSYARTKNKAWQDRRVEVSLVYAEDVSRADRNLCTAMTLS